jgi:hypothetical protein
METGIYWLTGFVIVLFIFSVMGVGEAVKAIAKEGRVKHPENDRSKSIIMRR